tara:strand:+ start:98 stop:322 length:225 start_codon:yes stop_codon:yes gene_type:complete
MSNMESLVKYSKSELDLKLSESQEALQNLYFQKSMQQLEDLSQIKKIRREIAQIKTVINSLDLNKKNVVEDLNE